MNGYVPRAVQVLHRARGETVRAFERRARAVRAEQKVPAANYRVTLTLVELRCRA